MASSRPGEPEAGPSGQGTVVVDIGVGRGALIVWAPPALVGKELEVRRRGTPWRGEHTSVRPRHLGTGTRFAAAFAGLDPGSYDVRERGSAEVPVTGAVVSGGAVGEVTWPGGGAVADGWADGWADG